MVVFPGLSTKGNPVSVRFWGTRGSIAAPGRSTVRYGGNTSCLEVRYGKESLILDGGTGIRLFGQARNGSVDRNIRILVTHTHMDHIAGLPFFGPALKNGQPLDIYGPPGLKKALQNLFPFPVLTSHKRIHEIRTGTLRLPPFMVSTQWLNHPGKVLGYRIRVPSGRSVVYISDHEPGDHFCHNREAITNGSLARWIAEPDLLVMDAQYFEAECHARRGWGHSSIAHTVHLALESGAKKLVLFHHDPSHSDRILEQKLTQARKFIHRSGKRLPCHLAREGWTLKF